MKGKNTDIAIVGAGGMGALFGSILSENGLDVVLIDPNREHVESCLLYTSPSPRDGLLSRMPSSA